MQRLALLHGVFILACGCGPRWEPPAASPEPTRPPRAPAGPATAGQRQGEVAPEPPADVTVLLRAEADVDGRPGDEAVVLRSDGMLEAGTLRATAAVGVVDPFWITEQARLEVAVLDRAAGRRIVIVALPIEEPEDPPNRYQIFAVEGGALRRIFDAVLGTYGVTELEVPGDGSVRYVEDGWTACERVAHAEETVARDRVTLRVDATGTLNESGRRATSERQRCDQLAACPFVYVLVGGAPVRVGEILRDLRGPGAYASQTLRLPASGARPLVVRLAEEKPEVTYLDAIHLEHRGRRVAPNACGARPRPAYCDSDREAHLLRSGEVLDLEFDLPGGAGPVVLHAAGYYVPSRSMSD